MTAAIGMQDEQEVDSEMLGCLQNLANCGGPKVCIMLSTTDTTL